MWPSCPRAVVVARGGTLLSFIRPCKICSLQPGAPQGWSCVSIASVQSEQELETDLQQARAVAQQAQRRAEGLQAALDASRRTLCAAGSLSVPPAAATRPQSPARPTSAPLRRPATAFSLCGPDSRGGVGVRWVRSPVGTSPLTGRTRSPSASRPWVRPSSAVQLRCAVPAPASSVPSHGW